MTPILLWLFRIHPSAAVATDLWFAVFTKLAAAGIHYRAGFVDWQAVKRLWCGSLPVTLLVSLVVGALGPVQGFTWLNQAIGALVLVTAVGLLIAPALARWVVASRGQVAERPDGRSAFLTVVAGAVLGLCVALTSIGAGALGSVMLLSLYPRRMTPHKLVATDIVHAIPVAVVAGVGYLLAGLVNLDLLVQLLVGSIPAAVLGSLVARRFKPRWIQIVLAVCLLGVGLKTF